MKTYNKNLVNYLIARAASLGPNLYDKYLTVEDIEDVMSWSEDDAKRVCTKIKNYVNDGPLTLPVNLCPWCAFTEDNCDDCSYKERHEGVCSSRDSDYRKHRLSTLLQNNFNKQTLLSAITTYEPEPKFIPKKGDRVLVGKTKSRRYFSHMEGDTYRCFPMGRDEWSSQGKTTSYTICEPWTDDEDLGL